MLSAITATFEKMRSEGDFSGGDCEDPDDAGGRMGAAVYRDPSLHRPKQNNLRKVKSNYNNNHIFG